MEYVTKTQFEKFQQETNNNFKTIKHTLAQHTATLMSIENTLKFYGDMYKINKDSIDELKTNIDLLRHA